MLIVSNQNSPVFAVTFAIANVAETKKKRKSIGTQTLEAKKCTPFSQLGAVEATILFSDEAKNAMKSTGTTKKPTTILSFGAKVETISKPNLSIPNKANSKHKYTKAPIRCAFTKSRNRLILYSL
jgi:hypothetical protein